MSLTTKQKFTPRSEETRKLIIEKTAHIFNRKGYSGTSLADLTVATKLTKGSIYGNFENKEAVALEAFKYNFDNLGKRIMAYVGKEENARDRLLAFTRFYRDDFNTMKYVGGCPLLNTGADSDDTNKKLKNEVVKAFESTLDLLAEIIEGGKQTRQIKSNIESRRYATLFFALIEGGILLSKTTNQKQYLLEVCERIDKIVEQELIV